MAIDLSEIPPRACAAAVAVASLLVLGSAARAAVATNDFQLHTTADLVNLCSAAPDDRLMTAAVNFCEGFTVGVYRTLAAEQGAMRHRLFCERQPARTRNQAIADFVAWARASPSVMSEAPTDAILQYLTERYPCAAP